MTTRVMREAMILAAEAEGENGKGKGKLVGYLRRLARDHPAVFGPLLGRLIPHEVTGSLTFRTHEEALAELEVAARQDPEKRVLQ